MGRETGVREGERTGLREERETGMKLPCLLSETIPSHITADSLLITSPSRSKRSTSLRERPFAYLRLEKRPREGWVEKKEGPREGGRSGWSRELLDRIGWDGVGQGVIGLG